MAMFVGKGVSYLASVLYHCYPYETVRSETTFLAVDVMAINVSIWATAAAFLDDVGYLPRSMLLLAVACLWTAWAMLLFHNNVRCVMQIFFALAAETFIGWQTLYSPSWVVGSCLYVRAAMLSPPCCRNSGPANHHRRGLWGWHEDFHLSLALADAAHVALALDFNSS